MVLRFKKKYAYFKIKCYGDAQLVLKHFTIAVTFLDVREQQHIIPAC